MTSALRKSGVVCALVLATMLAAGDAVSAVVIPNSRATTASGPIFFGFLGDSRRTYQWIIDDSQLGGLNEATLTGITWRQLFTQAASWPAADMNFGSVEVRISGGVEPSARSNVFAENIVGSQVLVRSGPLTIPAHSFPGNATVPCQFGYVVEFDTPYVYLGGNLVIELRDTGNGISSLPVESANPQAPGYGAFYSATWATGNLATQGTRASFVVTDLVVLPEPSQLVGACIALLATCGRRAEKISETS